MSLGAQGIGQRSTALPGICRVLLVSGYGSTPPGGCRIVSGFSVETEESLRNRRFLAAPLPALSHASF